MDINVLHAEQRSGKRKQPNYRKLTAWPQGKRQRLSRQGAKRLFDAMSTSLDSLFGVLQKNPDFPPHDQIHAWRQRCPWFSEGFRQARKDQAEFMVQHCIRLAQATNPKNAHSQRVKFDIYKWIASKFSPDVYGDKPPSQTTNVAIGFNVSTERLNEIRSKLDLTRDAYFTNGNPNRNTLPNSPSDTAPLLTDSATQPSDAP
jgi:hypothetical protein